ncbi:hypothetical protein BJ878DRAFT_416924 [Calycina marina]|uniref:ferroxidase n=1 Tax=Calycina marina TaxID=1763456 RepID=A0A9P7Z6T4_9HELO|nr:hypothetical protein BJ878DRAFT_416924 [Calycina marina]
MQRTILSRTLQKVQCRSLMSTAIRSKTIWQPISARTPATQVSYTPLSKSARCLSCSGTVKKGLSPETDNPQPTERDGHHNIAVPAELSVEMYHELSDMYMDAIVEQLEALQEEKESIDVEYSAGVLTLNFPPTGTYVINKQPPNKQIWLSSPSSGPKRYDWVVVSEGQDAKEGTGGGDWVYLRDGSLLTDLLLSEVGVDIVSALHPIEKSAEE